MSLSRRLIGFAFFLVLLTVPTFLSAQTPDSYYKLLYNNAESSLDKKDYKKADFWMARFLGLASLDAKNAKSIEDLRPLLKRRGLLPRAFISGAFDGGFLDWFVKSIYPRWGVDDKRVRERQSTFEIENASYKRDYFVTVTASPVLESWFVLENGIATREIVLPLGSFKDKPMIFFGKLFQGLPSPQFQSLYLETERHALHYFWKPEFFDVDGDGVPELWVRYNLTAGNGFVQILEVYKIKEENTLELLQRFRGDKQGFARRLSSGLVEVGQGTASQSGLSEMNFDSDRVETWKYSASEKSFLKISEKTIPNILLSAAWKEYYSE